MTFLADLHIHSKYARATSKDLDPEHLAFWGALKGLNLLATGDCVHPAWLAELKEKLTPEGTGFFRLKPELETEVLSKLPPACRQTVRFILSTEISTIYKKGEKTRKVHHLIYLPSFEAAERLATKLARVGNIASDGRPILGLDSRNLLEIALETDETGFFIPAHIWTPWFSALGAQSGFESLEACYGDLAPHIFAAETGLSSDPPMNWRVSSLDHYRLVSSSDAHSPAKLGREATRFSSALDFASLRHALEGGEGYCGTVEFFPEEGKYHMDGHRACEARLTPEETAKENGLCPVCGKPLTIGVAHRVNDLADRPLGAAPPPKAGTVESYVPLPEIIAELLGSSAASKRAQETYTKTLTALGPELPLLSVLPLEEIAKSSELLAEAIERLRKGEVIRQAGYDGAYGVIRLFKENELEARATGFLFEAPLIRRRSAPKIKKESPLASSSPKAKKPPKSHYKGLLAALDADQAEAAAYEGGPLIVSAGPGSGKTRLLTHRIAHFVKEKSVSPSACLLLTFTRRATEELQTRLKTLLPEEPPCAVHSFHTFGLALLRRYGKRLGLPPTLRIADETERKKALSQELGIDLKKAGQLVKKLAHLKRTNRQAEGEEQDALTALEKRGKAEGWIDFDDVIRLSVELLETVPDVREEVRKTTPYICVDEFQDVDEMQYRLIRALAPKESQLCVIGDPDQAIYGFRGALGASFERIAKDDPKAKTIRLARNYRSSPEIVAASSALMQRGDAEAMKPSGPPLIEIIAPTDLAEAATIASKIEELMGGNDLLTAARGKKEQDKLSFANFAILARTDAQIELLREALTRQGIPTKKSRAEPLEEHAGIQAILEALIPDEAQSLQSRIKEACKKIEQDPQLKQELLLEAKGWLLDLAATQQTEEALKEQIALLNESDFHDKRADRVSLLTMHAAKGLEFPVVFLAGVEEGLIPFSFEASPLASEEEAEERRLFYVALTRAEERLYLTRSKTRLLHGAKHIQAPSRFLKEIPSSLLKTEESKAHRPKPKQYSLF